MATHIHDRMSGFSKLTPIYRIFTNLFIQAGFPGTWGPGENAYGAIHIKDVGTGFVTLFKAIFEGNAKENEDGFCEYRCSVVV